MTTYRNILPSGEFRTSGDGRTFIQRLLGIGGNNQSSTNSQPQHTGLAQGPDQYVTDEYKTEDGEHIYKFGFQNMDTHVEIDILSSPSYGRHSDGLHNTHRLSSDRGGYRICFGDPSIVMDVNVARHWAAQWAELTSKYINTGEEFPNV